MVFPLIAGYVLGSRQLSRTVGLAASANEFYGQPATKVIDLDERLDRLTMVIEAMWILLREQGLTDEQLAAKVEELAEMNGGVRTTTRCPSCGAAVSRTEDHCQFCGQEMAVTPNPIERL
jgi:hypothetical protein